MPYAARTFNIQSLILSLSSSATHPTKTIPIMQFSKGFSSPSLASFHFPILLQLVF